jgi:hypothetical protein
MTPAAPEPSRAERDAVLASAGFEARLLESAPGRANYGDAVPST